ncbi:helix-turn-helix domain-containing protein [Brevibacillus humidisoli]|uniref:helix-turn-helix transcriptional regulator n=1 Tax=Brevibacillus humidisoli TaxID=2895522 RepID=UPI001E309E3C|nr:helix-turn-helix domain-containing protein [Brevibacillus humidisoli]UFJ41896.1 helix-turn-helix domain-containing protein [Brevibacillus humidisoli]
MDTGAHKLTTALADPTRFSIYQYVANQKKQVTVQEIANRFSIHPNVARLHLCKLEDVNLLQSASDKSGKGGRPSRLYSLSDQVVSLQFPPRDYQLIADIAVESLLSFGEAGEKALVRMGHRIGVEAAKRALQESGSALEQLTTEEMIESIQRLIVAQGLNPEIELLGKENIRFRVYNCTFSEIAKRYPNSICKMHNALLAGIFEVYFGEIELQEQESMQDGCRCCSYTVIRLDRGGS